MNFYFGASPPGTHHQVTSAVCMGRVCVGGVHVQGEVCGGWGVCVCGGWMCRKVGGGVGVCVLEGHM